MKKVKRLIEIKRQLALAQAKVERAAKKQKQLEAERSKIVGSFSEDEKRLYKEQIIRACRL